jgi:hypothetical protein
VTLRSEMTSTGLQFVIKCACGWESGLNSTAEGVGRAFDLHMAKMYPLPTSRRPCPAPERTPRFAPEDVKVGQRWERSDGQTFKLVYVQGGYASYSSIGGMYRVKCTVLARDWKLIGPTEAEATPGR